MRELFTQFVEWLYDNYKIMSGIVVPVLVAILGLLKIKQHINKTQINNAENNKGIISSGDLKHSFNATTTQNASSGALQIVNSEHVTVNMPHTDTKTIQETAEVFISKMYPKSEKAFEKLRLNSLSFLACLERDLQSLTPEELEKFSEAELQIVLQTAIKNASRKSDENIHNLLTRLIADRVRKPKKSIVELTLN